MLFWNLLIYWLVQANQSTKRMCLDFFERSSLLFVSLIYIFPVAVVGFRQLQYTVQENVGSLSFVIEVLQGNLQRSVNVTFSTEDNTAVGKHQQSVMLVFYHSY